MLNKTFFKKVQLVLILCISTNVNAIAIEDASPSNILRWVDEYRMPQEGFSVKSMLIEFKNGKKIQSMSMKVFSITGTRSDGLKTMVKFVEPLKDFGKIMLKNDSNIWFYDPTSKATIRISPQQRLLGQASNGDVVTVNLASQYTASVVGLEVINNGSNEKVNALHLKLKSASNDSYYGSGDLWVDAKSFRPIRLNYLSESGVLIKSMYFRKYVEYMGKERASEVVIFDGLDPKWITLIVYKDFTKSDVSEQFFQKSKMNSFKFD